MLQMSSIPQMWSHLHLDTFISIDASNVESPPSPPENIMEASVESAPSQYRRHRENCNACSIALYVFVLARICEPHLGRTHILVLLADGACAAVAFFCNDTKSMLITRARI
eukprot:Protomagalhaensia_sp_Gyna_25__3500@NODE_3146_length_710_cov_29_621461_g2632_i0_p2_GENE_NODE_3146_length_710_cov_29_621461_g2632_i0NODE_3146_length_710_cov_29_621461_g2632_i0_p2_ORF_typecomplete_len111_score5_89zincribbons_6/PF07191_12/0_38_NODE_3146_length_710_cov_29_621461_g2632_i0378710